MTTLRGPDAAEYCEWHSAWTDLLYVRQALFCRKEIPDTPANMFLRRAAWEGAAIGYGRCFKTGRRRALLKQLIDSLDASQRERHEQVIHWRDKHIGHRVDPSLEQSVAQVRVNDDGSKRVEVKLTVTPSPNEAEIQELEDLASTLMNMVHETRIGPLGTKILDQM
ncbi:hypothetical protein OCS65_18295 [Rhodococcus aetherivorans]|uniref:Uncharacterized protein n=1 Tax=Rhodococcus aetherivorans TaxID=191292 RepID=A0AA46NVR3_9NOCA|nr:hypothetical protein [Rhodococcus aetherivorans]UYF92431.1 hypothetical protein OCS65_18295 [Rhodococcus aetherivorans]